MNPQQPVQPASTGAAPREKKSRVGIIFVLMIISGVALLSGIVGWIAFQMKSSSDSGKTPAGLAEVLEPSGAAPQPRTIVSKLGVTVPYDARELAVFGFYANTTYSNNDTAEARPYSVIRVRPVETSEAAHNQATLAAPELRLTTSSDPDYWKKLAEKDGYRDISKIDMLLKLVSSQRLEDTMVTESSPSVHTYGDTEYKKVRFTKKDERYGVTSERHEDCYFAIKNDTPYIACIHNIRAGNFSALAQLESVLAGITYQTPERANVKVDIDAERTAMLDSSRDEKVDAVAPDKKQADAAKEEDKAKDGDMKSGAVPRTISPYLETTNNFRAFARSMPATVRVATLYCADIALTLPDGKPGPQLTGACIDKVGTGFVASSDGMVATSGANVSVAPREAIRAYITNAPNNTQMNQRLERVLKYLLEARSLMQTDIDALLAGVSERQQDIVEKIHALSDLIPSDRIALTKEQYSHAVQMSNKPITVQRKGDGHAAFAYTDTVLEATVIGRRVSNDKTQAAIAKGESVRDDAALLQLKKEGVYMAMPIAASSVVAKQHHIGVIGMPMYTYGTIETGQFGAWPMLRQGKVDQAFNGAGGQRLAVITTPSHAGFSGAPAIQMNGEVVGLASYNTINCPGAQCMGSLIMRDAAEIISIAKDRNKSLRPHSAVGSVWQNALDELTRGNYRQAARLLNRVAQQDSYNYLAAPLAQFATSQIGSESDTSMMNMGVEVSQIVVLASVVALILLIILWLGVRLFSRPRAVSQYGVAAGGQYIQPGQWQAQAPSPYSPHDRAAMSNAQSTERAGQYAQSPYYSPMSAVQYPQAPQPYGQPPQPVVQSPPPASSMPQPVSPQPVNPHDTGVQRPE